MTARIDVGFARSDTAYTIASVTLVVWKRSNGTIVATPTATMVHKSNGMYLLTVPEVDYTTGPCGFDITITTDPSKYVSGTLNPVTGDEARDSTVAKEATLATVASYVDTEIQTILDRLDAVGGLTGAHKITIQFYVGPATVTPIADVYADVYDSTNTARLNGTQLKSSANGQIEFYRDNGTYKIRAMKAGVTFTLGTVTVADGNATVTMYGTVLAIPAPPNAALQSLSGNVVRLNWALATGEVVKAIIDGKQAVNGALVQDVKLDATVDVNGQFVLSVPKSSRITLIVPKHGEYSFTVTTDDAKDISEYIGEGLAG